MQEGENPIRIVEVGGVKVEVDLRTAKVVNSYKVGDKVKVLVKSYSGYQSYPGFIVGFDAFQNLPTIVIGYVDNIFGTSGEVKFAYLNAQQKEVEICPMSEDDVVPNLETIRTYFDRSLAVKTKELEEMRARKEYFLRQYGAVFGVAAKDMVPPPASPAAA